MLVCRAQNKGGRNNRSNRTKKNNRGHGAKKRPREGDEAAPAKRNKTE